MKMKGIVLLFALAGLLFACSDANRGYVYPDASCFGYDDFQESKELMGVSWKSDSTMLLPTRLQVLDTLLAVLTPKENKILHLINLKNGERVASQLSIGQGPGEVLYPGLVNEPGKIVLADLMASAMLVCELPDFLQGKMENSRKIAFSRRTAGDIRVLGSHYIAPSYRDDFLFYVFDAEGNVVDSIGQYPEWKEPVTSMERRTMYEFTFTTNTRDRIAVCYNWANLIDILDEKGHLCRRLQGPQRFTSLFREERDGRVIGTFSVKGNRWDAYVTSVNATDGFWVSYNGKSVDDPDYEGVSHELFSFGWDGSLRAHYHLDEGILSFAVDEVRRKIYAIGEYPDIHLGEFAY